jgi:hypothetical protein
MSFLCQNGACSSSNRRRLRHRALAGTTALAGVLSFGVLQAQEVPDSARQVILDFSQRFEFSDNPDLLFEGQEEDRFTSRTTLLLGYGRRTGTDSFSFSLGGDLELRDDGDNGITNTLFGLGWARDVGSAQTGIALDVSEVELGSASESFFDEDTGSIDFGTIDQGTRRTADVTFEGAFGVDAPFGGTYRLQQREIRYSDTQDPDLQDADRLTLEGGLFFVLDPRITLGIEASQVDFDEDGPGERDRVTNRVGTYLETQINSRLTGRFDLGWEEVDETGTVIDNEDGVVFGVALEQEMPTSTVLFEALSEITINGRRNEVRAGQAIELPRGDLSYSLGLTRTEGFDTEPLLGLGWTQELPNGAVRVIFEQSAATGRDDENLINSRLSLGYQQELTARSAFDIGFSFIDRDEQADTGRDSKRYNLDLTYRYALTNDWDLATGVSLVRSEREGEADRDANTVFIGLERRFVWN